jgi:hypothetical protein
MKRNSLTTALLAGLAGAAGLASSANALNLNPDGLGQGLVYPYYTVNKSNQSLFSVVNTTNRVKAVKVRFVEGRNSKEVLDFNLYLSPFDVWTGAVVATGSTGPATLFTNDTSCTVPAIPAAGVAFRSFQYTGANRDWRTADDTPAGTTAASLAALLGSIDRTREGHLEMIEMGLLQTGTLSTQLAEEATHLQPSGVPANCQALVNAWTPGGGWATLGSANIDLPAGGLYGQGTIVDVRNGTLHAYNADAIEGFYTNSAAAGFLHRNPGTIQPDLGDADNGTGLINVFTYTGNGVFTPQTVPAGAKVQTTSQPYSYDAVSLLYMHDSIYNEYVTDASLGATSEWVITFPTKEAYVDVVATADVRAPFTNPFRDNGSACEQVTIFYWNREEAEPGAVPGNVDFSPPPPAGSPTVPALCYEAQVLAFNQSAVAASLPSSIFGSTYASNVTTSRVGGAAFTNGWARIVFDGPATGLQNVLDNIRNQPTGGLRFAGLPVTGFWSANYVNANAAPGVLANYSGAYRHRGSRALAP